MALSLFKRSLVLLAVPLCFEFVFVGALSSLLKQVEEERAAEAHARDVAGHMNRILALLVFRGTIVAMRSISGEKAAFRERLDKLRGELQAEDVALTELVASNAFEREAVERVRANRKRFEEQFFASQKLKAEGDKFGAMQMMARSQKSMQELFLACENIVEEQQEEQMKRKALLAGKREQVQALLLIGLGANTLIAFGLAVYFHRGTTRRFRLLIDNTFKLAGGQPLNPKLGGGDEVGQLDEAFHQLAIDLKEANDRERAVVDNAVDVICSIDAGGRIVAINPASNRLLGREPESLIGLRVVDLIYPIDLPSWNEAIAGARSSGTSTSFEVRMRHHSERLVDTQWAVSYSKDEHSLFCVIHDVTERKEAERLRQEVIAMVTHDLRTPLGTISGFHEMLESEMLGPVSPEAKKHLTRAMRSTDRMTVLIKDLLLLDRIKSGALPIVIGKVELKDVFEEAMNSASGWADEKGIVLKSVPNDLSVMADPDRLTQILVNLVGNAIKFSPQGGTVTISATRENDDLVVRVADQGVGIPQEMRERIFDRFQQVRSSDAQVKGGSGLGLAICKALVESHKGRIWVESEEQKGSTFAFTLNS